MPVQEEGLDEVNENAMLAATLIVKRHYLMSWAEIGALTPHQLSFLLDQIDRYDRQ
jgi:hypothetical protein